MNVIELRTTDKAMPGPEGDARALHTCVLIDGKPVGERFVLDWREFYLTVQHPGEFFFWTSLNGEPLEENIQDCVFVERTETEVTWRWLSPISMDDLGDDDDRDEVVAVFAVEDYDRVIRQGWWRACAALRAAPALQVYPRGFGESGLLGLEEWAKTAKPFQPIYATFAPATN